MQDYEQQARDEMQQWQQAMLREPGMVDRFAVTLQNKVNSYIPERVHQAVTAVIKQMTRAVLAGSTYTTVAPRMSGNLQEREAVVRERIESYRRMAAAEGGITGAGGFLLGLADFPLLLTIKLKMLFELAACYGYNTEGYQERIYLLRIVQLAFSSDTHRRTVYLQMVDWDRQCGQLPASMEGFEWREFQQEYRNYLDLAKMAQMLPVIGAPVGYVVNSTLVRKLGEVALQAYRMRWFEQPVFGPPPRAEAITYLKR